MTTRHLQITAAVIFSAAATALAQSYTITDLGTLGGSSSQANAIGAHGVVAGVAETKDGTFHAFLYSGRAMRDIGMFGGSTAGAAQAINARGEVAGFYYEDGYHAIFWSNGKVTELGNLGGDFSAGWALNESGDVAGSSDLADKREHAFLYTGGQMIDLGTLGGKESVALGVNARRQVTGYAQDENGRTFGFLWENGKMTSLGSLGGNWSQANAINEAGQIAGVSYTESGSGHAFLWSGGTMTDLGDLGFRSSDALALNSAGTVVVGYARFGMDRHAFVWSGGRMQDLNALVRNPAGWLLLSATGVDDRGVIVGYGYLSGDLRGFVLTPEATASSGRRRATH